MCRTLLDTPPPVGSELFLSHNPTHFWLCPNPAAMGRDELDGSAQGHSQS